MDEQKTVVQALSVLLNQYQFDKGTLSRYLGMAAGELGLLSRDVANGYRIIEDILAYPAKRVGEAVKYKVAVTVMGLGFFLKDCEPEA